VSGVWDAVWDELNRRFVVAAGQAVAGRPDVPWSAGRNANEVFPFWAWLAFRDDPDGDDLVLSVSFRIGDDSLTYTTDVVRDDGTIVADGPSGSVRRSADGEPERTELDAALERIGAFVDGVGPLLRHALH
jgi:hypothetical protein